MALEIWDLGCLYKQVMWSAKKRNFDCLYQQSWDPQSLKKAILMADVSRSCDSQKQET